MQNPPALIRGNKVAFIATARRVTPDNIETGIEIVKNWGLEVILSPYLFSTDHGYLAGTDDQRIAALQQFLDDPDITAIFCARGGYGTTRIIDKIDFSGFKKNPKWIIGFSDITALHLKIQSIGFQSIHGTMPILFSRPDSDSSLQSLFAALFDEPMVMPGDFNPHNISGRAEGILIGGNLSLIVDSLGTSYEAETEGKLLVLEEVDEYLYRIDRMIVQLKRAGKLNSLAGLIVGHFSEIKDTELSFGESIEEIIRFHTKDYNYPIAFGFPTGHQNPNHAWISGRKGLLEVSSGNSSLKHLR